MSSSKSEGDFKISSASKYELEGESRIKRSGCCFWGGLNFECLL